MLENHKISDCTVYLHSLQHVIISSKVVSIDIYIMDGINFFHGYQAPLIHGYVICYNTHKIIVIFLGENGHGSRTNWLDFSGELNPHTDPGFVRL